MTILFLSRRFYPDIGGVEKHIMEISRELINKKHRIIIISENNQSYKNTREIINGIESYKIYTGKKNRFTKFKLWIALWKLRNSIQSADVVHCHDVFFWYLPFRFLFPLKPVYTTFHGYEGYPVTKKAVVIRKLSEKLSKGNICIGDYIKKWYGTKPTYVSYGAISNEDLKIGLKNDYKKESAVFIGRLDEQTGILTYVKAFEKIKKRYPKFDLLVIGDGKYKRFITKKVKVTGFQINPEKYFANYHFAFVSRYLASLEAMAAKRLIFCVYDNPLKRDCFTLSPFAKWIVMAKNEEQLIKKVAYYLDHPEKEKILINNAYKWVKNQTWKKMTDLYLELWKM